MAQFVQFKEAVADYIALESWPHCAPPTRRTEKGSMMSRTSGQLAGNVRPAADKSPRQNQAIVLRRTFVGRTDELVRISEAMSGGRPAAERVTEISCERFIHSFRQE